MSDSRLTKKSKLPLTETSSGEKWDAFHKDPSHNVIIKSSDGVMFRTSSYRLGQTSTVLANIFEVPPASGDNVIEMRHLSGTIRIFLDYASSSLLPEMPELALATACDLRAMVDFYDCIRLRSLAELALSNAAKGSPMDYLTLAAEKGDMGMVREAIKFGTGSGKAPDAAQFLQILPKMDAETQKYVIESMAVTKTRNNIELKWPEDGKPMTGAMKRKSPFRQMSSGSEQELPERVELRNVRKRASLLYKANIV